MNITELKASGINYEEGLRRFANKPELYSKYLVKFFEDTSFEALGTFLAEKNYSEAFKAAHTLKGTSGNLSMTDFYLCVCNIVEALRNNQNDNVDEMYNELVVLYNELVVLYNKAKEAIL